MYIYLDESYNFQKNRGKLFISINGFAVLNANRLRKRWKHIRKPYVKHNRRIHAADPYFADLKIKSAQTLNYPDVTILSVFQVIQEIPYDYFNKSGMNFDNVYAELLKELFQELSLQEYKRVRIIIDSRKHSGGTAGADNFQQNISHFLINSFSGTNCSFESMPSYLDILVELADFVSNTLYQSYQQGEISIFKQLGYKLIQIKNPL